MPVLNDALTCSRPIERLDYPYKQEKTNLAAEITILCMLWVSKTIVEGNPTFEPGQLTTDDLKKRQIDDVVIATLPAVQRHGGHDGCSHKVRTKSHLLFGPASKHCQKGRYAAV